MSTIVSLFEQAQLAEAAYANLIPGNSLLSELQNADNSMHFSPTQATAFVSHWKVVSHQPDTGSGFSGTLFESLDQPGSYAYALRGTAGLDDLNADWNDIATDGLALDQIVDMYNDWQRITHSGVYQAAVLETQLLETAAYALAKAGQFVPGYNMTASSYLEWLNTRTDIVIDQPLGLVRKVAFVDSTDVFTDSRQFGQGIEISSGQLSVTGHSLGGHLAAAFTRLFPDFNADAVTVNGAGFATGAVPGIGGYANINIPNLFSMLSGASAFSAEHIQNVYGEGPTVVTMNSQYGLVQPGGHQEIYIESANGGNTFGHGASQMTDSLAIYSLFATLDPTLNNNPATGIPKITDILKASASNETKSLETTVAAFATLFQENYRYSTATYNALIGWIDDREDFYTRLYALETYLTNESGLYNPVTQSLDLTVDKLTNVGAGTLATNAQSDLAYAYTLYKLNPFVIHDAGTLYSTINTNGSLDRYDSDTRTGNLTEEYLKDRAAFLYNKIIAGNRNNDANGSAWVQYAGNKQYFQDWATGYEVFLGMDQYTVTEPLADKNQIKFGSVNIDTLTGGRGVDEPQSRTENDTPHRRIFQFPDKSLFRKPVCQTGAAYRLAA